MTAPRAPGVGDTIDKWESWIEKYLNYLSEEGRPRPFLINEKFNTYKLNVIKGFGSGWNTALKFGDDKKYIKIMEINWKFTSYLWLKGVKPKTFGMRAYT